MTIAGAVLLGGAIPLFFRLSDRVLHLLVAFATGIFLGAVFLHLIPQIAELAALPGSSAELAGGHQHHSLWLFVLAGLLGVYLLEHLILNRATSDPHRTLGYASLFGLCIHSFTSGVGLSVASRYPAIEKSLYFSIASHKSAEAFSLATVFLLAGFGRGPTLAIIALFSLVTPAGILFGSWMVNQLSSYGVAVLTSLAAGTFLFVALCDLLPEVFHDKQDELAKVALLLAGIGASAIAHA